MIVYPFAGNEIELAEVNGDTFVLLNRKHTGLNELAEVLHVRTTDVESYLQFDSKEKPLSIHASKDACEFRMLRLLRFASAEYKKSPNQ